MKNIEEFNIHNQSFGIYNKKSNNKKLTKLTKKSFRHLGGN